MVATACALIPRASSELITNHFAPATDCVAERRGAEPCIFRGIGQWPDLDQLFSDRSEDIIRRCGVNDWALAGGVLRPDGRPSFDSPSVVAYQTLQAIIEESNGFTYSDDAGVQWAALFPKAPSRDCNQWRGIAIGADFPLKLLESQLRINYLRALSARLHELVLPGQSPSLNSQNERVRSSATHRRLQLLDAAIKAVPVLYTAAKTRGRNKVCVDSHHLAVAAWGGEAWWPENWINTIFEAMAMLGTFRVQTLNLPKTGWDPQSHNRRTAVSNVEWLDSHFLNIQMAPKFMDFVTHWLCDSRWESPPISSLAETVCPHSTRR